MPSELEKKNIKKRFKIILDKLIKNYIVFYAEKAKRYNMVLVKRGK